MSEEAEDDNDPNVNFNVEHLNNLVDYYSSEVDLDKASEILNDDRITLENKKAAVNLISSFYTAGMFGPYPEVSDTMLLRAAYCGAPIPLMNKLYDIGDNRLIMHKSIGDGGTALHRVCWRERPFRDNVLDTVMFLVEKGGRELLMMQDDDGHTAFERTMEFYGKENEVYKYLIEARDYPFHTHCSTPFVTASTIQKYIDKDGPDCLLQVNKTNMTPLQKLLINQSAPRDSINLAIVTMLQQRGIHE
jgi:hypothetical protein